VKKKEDKLKLKNKVVIVEDQDLVIKITPVPDGRN